MAAPTPGARPLVAILPSGRAIWLRLHPAPAQVREIDRITASMDLSYALNARTLDSNAAAAGQLRMGMMSDAAELDRSRVRAHRGLLGRIADGDARLDRRIDRSLIPAIHRAKAQQVRQLAVLRASAHREMWNQLVIASAVLLMAAYGQPGHPLAENNLVIATALSVWLFGDEIVDLLLGKRSLQTEPIRGTDWWSYTAPFANLLTGWWLLSDRQNERFIVGSSHLPLGRLGEANVFATVAEVVGNQQTDTCWATIDMSSRVAPEHLADFQVSEKIPVLAAIESLEPNTDVPGVQPTIELLMADVTQGFLRIVVRVSAAVAAGTPSIDPPPLLKRLHVAWAVDTRQPRASG